MIFSSQPFQAILFDLDGTLIDSSPSILNCFGSVLHDAGLRPLVPLTDSLIGPPLRQTLINLTGETDAALLDCLVDGFKECYDTEGYKATKVYGGVDAMLELCASRSIPLAIATNKRRIPTLKILHHLGWGNYFRIVGTLDTPVPSHVNKAALIGALLNELGTSADRSLYVGDKYEDGKAAAANRMLFCAAGWGYGEWDTVKTVPEWHIAPSVHKFVDTLLVPNHI